jgi:hypothetical protein
MRYTDKELIERAKQVEGFNGIPSVYWILGIRSHADLPNKFDDTFYLMKGEKSVLVTTGTTNPGTPILQGGFMKYNKDGAAVLKSDKWYGNVWQYGMHQGKIPALKQLGAPVTIFREGDRDNKSEEIGKMTTGYYGINFHPDQYNINAADSASENIGGWSAGCQVCNNISDYRKIIDATRKQKFVTYLLLNEFSV